ncbi:YdeI family protein [Lewinella sp. W8]|uniref:YdeI/OmpD-associated family protein n=1 Tax=Lewinella sp. W8 TaxID=2528208 RepID=UPI001068044F|nr:DUF1801 domain-containing protein [Lewinella sp. W8]MTB52245.1 hypothetical protein [Lewinella sp. W8]
MSKPTVEDFLSKGCMRCPYGDTPDCKVHQWTTAIRSLRTIILESPLEEEIKWGVPCYTHEGKNIVMISALRDNCVLSFLKGALLNDPYGLLEKPGANSRVARVIRFRSDEAVSAAAPAIRDYLAQAIQVEREGRKVPPSGTPEKQPEELVRILEEDPPLRMAFEALTPGRQRGYIIYFSAPKKSETRISRIERSKEKILEGIGLHDKYSGKRK